MRRRRRPPPPLDELDYVAGVEPQLSDYELIEKLHEIATMVLCLFAIATIVANTEALAPALEELTAEALKAKEGSE